jgi:hypothetical protein
MGFFHSSNPDPVKIDCIRQHRDVCVVCHWKGKKPIIIHLNSAHFFFLSGSGLLLIQNPDFYSFKLRPFFIRLWVMLGRFGSGLLRICSFLSRDVYFILLFFYPKVNYVYRCGTIRWPGSGAKCPGSTGSSHQVPGIIPLWFSRSQKEMSNGKLFKSRLLCVTKQLVPESSLNICCASLVGYRFRYSNLNSVPVPLLSNINAEAKKSPWELYTCYW